MMNTLTSGRWRRWAIALGVAASAFGGPVLAQAQTPGATTVTFTPTQCTTNNYPEVICTVTIIDAKGVPVSGLTQPQFDVSIDNSQPVLDLKVTGQSNRAQRVNTVLVLDLGATSAGLSVESLKGAARSVLQSVVEVDQIAMIGITGKIELGDTVNPPLDSKKEINFVEAGTRRNEVINLVTTLQPQGNTPLYDAVCKALILAVKQNIGPRAVVVISDGRDIKSSTCVNPDDPIDRARADRTPIYAIGVGANLTEDYLRRLTLQTGGLYLGKATEATAVESKFKDVQTLLKTQYEVRFRSPLASDNADHSIKVAVNIAGGRAEGSGRFKAVPSAIPEVKRVGFKVNDQDVSPRDLPTSGDLVIEPEIAARKVVRVEYDLGGETYVVDQQPFAGKIPLTKLPADQDLPLVIRVVGDAADPKTITTVTQQLFVKPAVPTPVPTVAKPTPTPVPAFPPPVGSPLFFVMIAVILLLIALIGLVMFLVLRRRNGAAHDEDMYVAPTGVFTGGDSGSMLSQEPAYDAGPVDYGSTSPQGYQPTSVIPAAQESPKTTVMAPEGAKTQVMGGGSSPAPKTMVFRPPLAVLEFSTGELLGRRFELGGSNTETVAVGREVTGPADVKFSTLSGFVSRRHAEITARDGKLYAKDLGSSSGSKVNGVPLVKDVEQEIKVGDTVEFADARAEVKAAIA